MGLRVCFVSQQLPLTGSGEEYGYLWPLCRSLAKKGHDITIITADTKAGAAHITKDKVNIHFTDVVTSRNSPHSGLKESIFDRFEQLHIEKPFDIVHSVDNSGYDILMYKKTLNVKVIVDVKGIELDQIFGILGLTEETVPSYIKTAVSVGYRFLKSFYGADHTFLKKADGIIAASLEQVNILERFYFIPSVRTHVIPYGIDGRSFEPALTKPDIMKELEIDPDDRLILTISPLINVEEIKNLLNAFEKVVIKKPKTALVIVGDGPRRKELEYHMLTLALASKVWFAGHADPEKIHAYINACDVYVNLDSKSSGFEPTFLEAMACGKMAIASEVGTGSTVITNGVDGFLVRPSEVKALYRLLLEAVSGQLDSVTIGMKAREKILKMFDTERMVEQTIQVYKSIILKRERGLWPSHKELTPT